MSNPRPDVPPEPSSDRETVAYRTTPRPGLLGGADGPTVISTTVSPNPGRSRVATAASRADADYVLGDLLGQGGMGRVYQARQVALDRLVAVKIMRDELVADAEAHALFLAEALVSAELDHPQTVPVYDIGTTESGAPFYAMKVVTGQRWSTVLPRNTVSQNLHVLLEVSDAVAFAHDRGVIHRDLKPDNVMIGAYGETLLLDWGLAGSVGNPRARPLAADCAICGTPAYMAPEVAGGRVDEIGRASDVYLLAAILFEIVTGAPPHFGDGARACIDAAARNELPPAPAASELLDIALQGLRTNPADRYASVREFQSVVRDYLAHAESRAVAEQGVRRFEALPGADRDDVYRECNEIIALFKHALVGWPGNRRAGKGLVRVRQALAAIALRRGEIQLARSHGRAIEAECREYNVPLPPADEVAEQIKATVAEQERQARQRMGYG